MPVWQNWPLVTWPVSSSSPTMRTSVAFTGLALPATLNSTFADFVFGKVISDRPVLVVTVRATSMPDGPSSTE